MALEPYELRTALDTIARWRLNTEQPVPCLRCGAAGLSIEDRSARPYAEWYHLACKSCGLDETLHIPLGPAVMGGHD